MITILGATGNVGSKIAKGLLTKGAKVRVVGRDANKLQVFKNQGAEPAIGDLNNVSFLTQSLKGSDAAFVMIPPDYSAPDFMAHYRKASEAIAAAIKASGLQHVVNLSSFGAEFATGTGPIKALHRHEQLLNQLENVNILHLRPTYFMENLLSNVPLVANQSIMGSAIKGDVALPMIATHDIADHAIRRLVAKDFLEKSTQDLLGPRDIKHNDVAEVVSEVVGKKVNYVTFDYPSTRTALVSMGFSKDTAEQFVEMSEAFNSGKIHANGKRNAQNTTATGIKDFVQIFKQ